MLTQPLSGRLTSFQFESRGSLVQSDGARHCSSIIWSRTEEATVPIRDYIYTFIVFHCLVSLLYVVVVGVWLGLLPAHCLYRSRTNSVSTEQLIVEQEWRQAPVTQSEQYRTLYTRSKGDRYLEQGRY